MKKHSRIIQLRNGEVTLKAPKKLVKDIESTIFSSIIKNESSPKTYNFNVEIQKENYVLYSSQSREIIVNDISELLFELEWRVVDKLVRKNNNVLQFHSAAMKYNQEGFLFIGEGGSGKTSFSIFLLRNNFDFLSDEIGMLDPKNYKIYPFPRNLIIKNILIDQIDVSEDRKVPIDDQDDKIDSYFINPERYGKVEIKQFPTVKKIFFLTPQKNYDGYTINRIGDFESVNKLLYFCFNRKTHGDNLINFISDIVEQSKTYELKISNPLTLDNNVQTSLLKEIKEC